MTTLGQMGVGSIVTLNENGVPQNYIVVHQGIPDETLYDSSCNGTWLLRQNIYANAQWNSTNNNTFVNATVNTTYLPGLLSIYDAGVAGSIKTVKIPYCVGNYNTTINSGSNGWECQLFLLSGYEVGWTTSINQSLPIDGAVLDYFEGTTQTDAKRIAYLNSNPTRWWLRSPPLGENSINAWYVLTNGNLAGTQVTNNVGIRPAMILPQTMTVNDDNSIAVPYITTGQAPVGSIVKVKESGVPVDYIVVNQGIPQDSPLYDESCNGTWLLRKDIYANAVWDAGNQNAYGPSDVNTNYLPNTILPLYDVDFQNVIKQVKIPYVNGIGNSPVASGANGLSTKLFLLGGYEVGWTTSTNSYFPVDGAVLSYFQGIASADSKRIAYLNNSPTNWWLRSPNINIANNVWIVYSNGDHTTRSAGDSCGVRPAFILPTNLLIDSDNNILSQSFTITVPQVFMQGQSIPISWTPWTLSTGGTVTYTIERDTGSGWTQIATGVSATNYNDTAQTGWTQVQYQITPVIDGTNGPSVQSAVIPGVADAVLAISGIDQNLGTITSNVQYTVVSNTGNQISLTRTVNGAQVVTIQVDSGFSYNIPIADLPTGTGTIVITASVEDSSQEIQTVTRTWTYYKTPITIPSTGGIAQLTQNGQNIWPITIPDAVEAPVYLGGNLNAALNKLGQAVLYSKVGQAKYNEVIVDLSKVNVGDEVLLPENEAMVPFYVGSTNYEPTLNTSGTRVLLVRKDVYQNGQWNASNVNTYANSTIDTWFNSTYLPILDSTVQEQIGTTAFPYTPGNGDNMVTTLSRAVFALSLTELGISYSYANVEGTELSIADALKITSSAKWSRTPSTNGTNKSWLIDKHGNLNSTGNYFCSYSYGYRPCFTLPTTFSATYYVDQEGGIHAEQEYTVSGDFADLWGNHIPVPKIETGSYVGTGTYSSYGSSTFPNTLTFSFNPKFVIIVGWLDSSKGKWYSQTAVINCSQDFFTCIFPFNATSTQNINFVTGACYLIKAQNSISWYYDSVANMGSSVFTDYPTVQLNKSGVTYEYIAIG